MRQVVLVAAALFLIGCGPDPNAQLPGLAAPSKSGGASGTGCTTTSSGGAGGTSSGNGGTVGSGGTTTSQGGSGGGNPFLGGTTGSTGGIISSGGKVGTGGAVSTGGVDNTGGVVDAGGKGGGGVVGSGGQIGTDGGDGSGGVVGIDGGGISTAACANATPISTSVTFNTTSAFCFVTCDSTTDGWGCDSFTEKDRTVTVNGKAVTCGATLPAKNTGGYYYFEIGPGGQAWDSIHLNGPKVAPASCPVPAGGFSPSS